MPEDGSLKSMTLSNWKEDYKVIEEISSSYSTINIPALHGYLFPKYGSEWGTALKRIHAAMHWTENHRSELNSEFVEVNKDSLVMNVDMICALYHVFGNRDLDRLGDDVSPSVVLECARQMRGG